MERRSRALVVIPAFNEEEALPSTLAELLEVRPDLDVVVISDGSVDKTAALARAAGVAVVELPFNLGIGGALQTGFRYAVRHGYERAVQFDGDGQHDPREIAKLEQALDDGRGDGRRQPVRRGHGRVPRRPRAPGGDAGAALVREHAVG